MPQLSGKKKVPVRPVYLYFVSYDRGDAACWSHASTQAPYVLLTLRADRGISTLPPTGSMMIARCPEGQHCPVPMLAMEAVPAHAAVLVARRAAMPSASALAANGRPCQHQAWVISGMSRVVARRRSRQRAARQAYDLDALRFGSVSECTSSASSSKSPALAIPRQLVTEGFIQVGPAPGRQAVGGSFAQLPGTV